VPSLLDSIAADTERADNADLAQAQHDLNWTSTFRSTPPAEVSRARVNYTDTIERALSNKIALQARSDIGAIRLQQKAAEHEEWVKQAPLREQLLKAHVDATGATERRKALESKMTMDHTANVSRGMADFYANGGKPGTPDAQRTFLGLIADNPMAHADHTAEIGKANGMGNKTPEELAADAAALRDSLVQQGVDNFTLGSNRNGVTFRQNKDAMVADAGFKGTPEEARAKYGPDALLHENAKGIWTVTIPADAQAVADRAVLKQQGLNALKPGQQEIIDNLVAKKRALNALNPSTEDRIAFEVAKKSALKDLDPTDAEKIASRVAQQSALDALKLTPDQKIAYDVAHKKAMQELELTPDQKIAYDVAHKKALQELELTPDEKTTNAVARQNALGEARTKELVARADAIAKAHGIPTTIATVYSAKLGEISGLDQEMRDTTDPAKKAELQAKKIKNEEVIRSLESIHPQLRATRGLDAPATAHTGPAAVVAPASEGPIGPPSPDTFADAMAVKVAYKAGQLSKELAAKILRDQFGHQ